MNIVTKLKFCDETTIVCTSVAASSLLSHQRRAVQSCAKKLEIKYNNDNRNKSIRCDRIKLLLVLLLLLLLLLLLPFEGMQHLPVRRSCWQSDADNSHKKRSSRGHYHFNGVVLCALWSEQHLKQAKGCLFFM